jgi:hypothetical protein
VHLAIAQPADFKVDVFAQGRGRDLQTAFKERSHRGAGLRDVDAGFEAGESAHGLRLLAAAHGGDIDLPRKQDVGGLC